MKLDIPTFLPSILGLQEDQYPLKGFRNKQITDWIYDKGAKKFSDMTNISKESRETLEKNYCISPFRKIKELKSDDGSTKMLYTLNDGQRTEAVYMPYKKHTTICISSMVGCPMNCTFCATGNLGFTRNLTQEEILAQLIMATDKPKDIRNVVFMGMGEPLLNYDNMIKTIRMMVDPKYLDMSPRRIVVSTVGIPNGIRKLADEDMELKLALSLHAPDDETRKKIIPAAMNYSIKEIMDAVNYYYENTKRRLTFEYTMLSGINDSDEQAEKLVKITKRYNCHVNLIPFNHWEGSGLESSNRETIERFEKILQDAGVQTSVRWSRGSDVGAACGQLALKEESDEKKETRGKKNETKEDGQDRTTQNTEEGEV